MEKKYSEGQWRCDTYMSQNHIVRKVVSDKVAICAIRTNNSDEAHANSKLIAAAPDLLEASEKAKEIIDYLISISDDINLWSDKRQMLFDASTKINLAIKKATE